MRGARFELAGAVCASRRSTCKLGALDRRRAPVAISLRHRSPIDQHDAVAETFRVPGTERHGSVAGRVVILAMQEVKTKVPNGMMAAAPSKGKSKTEHAGRKGSQPQASTKVELHLAGTDSVNEVVFIEAWADQATQLGLRCKVGGLISITGLAHSLTPSLTHAYSLIHSLRKDIKCTCGVSGPLI